jgi:hypothetical protein
MRTAAAVIGLRHWLALFFSVFLYFSHLLGCLDLLRMTL